MWSCFSIFKKIDSQNQLKFMCVSIFRGRDDCRKVERRKIGIKEFWRWESYKIARKSAEYIQHTRVIVTHRVTHDFHCLMSAWKEWQTFESWGAHESCVTFTKKRRKKKKWKKRWMSIRHSNYRVFAFMNQHKLVSSFVKLAANDPFNLKAYIPRHYQFESSTLYASQLYMRLSNLKVFLEIPIYCIYMINFRYSKFMIFFSINNSRLNFFFFAFDCIIFY